MDFGELRDLLARHVRPDAATAIDGLHIARIDRQGPPYTSMTGTVLAVLAQGAKRLAVGDRVLEYRPGSYLVASVDLPVSGHFFDIAPGRPALGLAITLDPAAIADLLLHAGPADLPRPPAGALPGLAVAGMTADLLDALIRLVRLLDRPRDRAVLAPLVKREILWRLLTGEQGGAVRQLGLADSSLSHIARAIRWIQDHYAEPFRVADLARMTGMSASAFHRHFQTVTALSPIQFQKQVRLQHARLLLATCPQDITAVAHRVGYDSPSQFSREYRRQYGLPPSRDAARLQPAAS
ncbi:Transcriptional regulator, AraC family [[Actinomadura] parvosata subsp. kistnae]|uniref:AraC family transcriptional regulator n=1 Tax=[Actinomadura] parvosata subsp. kistnae TaxID=1909395 RepID=A0A1U9ZVD3_9ACTN|nr:AraC family transcriptional regulator [Nonomuraea sp. ATCC 55076]AQZ61897.1 AraC family transcriptional regulator [Nonomuraea sp. ATCC 55076]SPL88054.1 Transcriptional regulator, AraC family [Actinomadura parvosata subsp. kistnae]